MSNMDRTQATGSLMVCDDSNRLKIIRKKIECCVSNCLSKTVKVPNLSYYTFPKNQLMRSNWAMLISSLNHQLLRINDQKKVCSLHFTEESFDKSTTPMQLDINALPVVFPNSPHQTYVRQILSSMNKIESENVIAIEKKNLLIKISQYAYNENDRDVNFYRNENYHVDIKSISETSKEELDVISKNYDTQQDPIMQIELQQHMRNFEPSEQTEVKKIYVPNAFTGSPGQMTRIIKQPQVLQKNNGQYNNATYNNNVKIQQAANKNYISEFCERDMLSNVNATKFYKIAKDHISKQDEHIKILKQNNQELLEKFENFKKHIEYKYGIVLTVNEILSDDNIEYVGDEIIVEEQVEDDDQIILEDSIVIEEDDDIVEEVPYDDIIETTVDGTKIITISGASKYNINEYNNNNSDNDIIMEYHNVE